jgi:hypothetical protein
MAPLTRLTPSPPPFQTLTASPPTAFDVEYFERSPSPIPDSFRAPPILPGTNAVAATAATPRVRSPHYYRFSEKCLDELSSFTFFRPNQRLVRFLNRIARYDELSEIASRAANIDDFISESFVALNDVRAESEVLATYTLEDGKLTIIDRETLAHHFWEQVADMVRVGLLPAVFLSEFEEQVAWAYNYLILRTFNNFDLVHDLHETGNAFTSREIFSNLFRGATGPRLPNAAMRIIQDSSANLGRFLRKNIFRFFRSMRRTMQALLALSRDDAFKAAYYVPRASWVGLHRMVVDNRMGVNNRREYDDDSPPNIPALVTKYNIV